MGGGVGGGVGWEGSGVGREWGGKGVSWEGSGLGREWIGKGVGWEEMGWEEAGGLGVRETGLDGRWDGIGWDRMGRDGKGREGKEVGGWTADLHHCGLTSLRTYITADLRRFGLTLGALPSHRLDRRQRPFQL